MTDAAEPFGLAVAARQWLSRRVGVKRAVSRGLARGHRLARRVGLAAGYPLQVCAYRLLPQDWPTGLSLRVVALADLHFGGTYLDEQRLRLIVDRTNGLAPDLVVLLGDYGASHFEGPSHRVAVRALGAELRRLSAPWG